MAQSFKPTASPAPLETRIKKSGGTPLHRERMKKRPKKPKKTAEELAAEARNKRLLDEEIEKSEEKFAALARGKLGNVSLLSGAPRNVSEAVGGRRSSGGGGAGSLLGGARGAGVSGGSSSPNRVTRGVYSRK